VSRNIRYHLRNLSRIRKYLDESSAHDAVRALVLSRLDYCNSLLYGTTSQNLQRLQLLQNHAAKLVYNKPKFTRVTPLLNDLHWLPISRELNSRLLHLRIKPSIMKYLLTFLSSCTSASLHTTSGP